ncbi:MAG: hypothetical protein ACE5I1_29310 [bacterium]
MVIAIQYADAKPFWGDGLVGVTLTGVKKKGESDKVGGWLAFKQKSPGRDRM